MQMFQQKPWSFYAALATLVLGSGAALGWLYWPDYQPLELADQRQQAAVLQSLEAQAIEYKVDAAGQILVESSQLGKSQILQQQQAQPGPSKGLELYDQVDYAMTEHTQQVTLQRALQGELERTISALGYVRQARVHLTMPVKRLFEPNQELAKAAVTIFPLQPLNSQQVEGIQTLVAGAVEGLQKQQVMVVDGDGKVLTRNSDPHAAASTQETELQQKLEHLLGLVWVPADFAVSVSVQLGQKDVRQTSRQLLTQNGQGAVLRKSESSQKAAAGNPAQVPGSQTQQTETEYTHGQKTEEIMLKAGQIERVSAAVWVRAQLSIAEQQQLKESLGTAIGLQPSRGDELSLQLMPVLKTDKASAAMPEHRLSADQEQPASAVPVATSWYWITGILLLAGLGWAGQRAYQRRRLRQQHRQALLEDVKTWLAGNEQLVRDRQHV